MTDNSIQSIHTEGGAAVTGDINTQGGDFVGRDKNIITDARGNVHIGDIVYAKTEVEETREALGPALKTLHADLFERYIQADNPPDEPYRHLYYFDMEHKSIFHGREAALSALLAQIERSSLTLLHAPSGAGKTSLLKAALLPALIRKGDLPVYIHHPREPVNSIKGAIFPSAPHPEKLTALPLRTFLMWTREYLDRRRLVIVLDQFEEFFIQQTAPSQLPFIIGLADCCAAENLPLKFILAMRKDYYSDMAAFKKELPEVFHNDFLLPSLTRAEAAQAIAAPLNGRGLHWADGAVESLLEYLYKGEIEPPHLQLICSRLYKQTKDDGAKVISVEGVDLKSFHTDYLMDVMEMKDEKEKVRHFTTQQRDLAWCLLKRLVTSDGTKQVLPLKTLYGLAPRVELDLIIKHLVDQRLLRRDESDHQTTIEVAHDTLAAQIALQETDQERRQKVARELVERGLATWNEHKVLMDAPTLGVLDGFRDALVDPGKDALKFLFRSALAAEHETEYWFKQAKDGGVDVAAILQERLASENFRERVAVVRAFGEMKDLDDTEPLYTILNDDYPQVRAAAIHALECLQPSGEWRTRLKYECYVPAGEFIMGDDHGEYDDEKPAHKVNLEAFYIAKTPVTNTEYKRFRDDAGGAPFDIPAGKEKHPVVEVTWYDARDYAHWAEMRLLTEAEWEKAASWDGERKRKYPWGDEYDKNRCNTSESGIGKTTPVDRYGEKGASPCEAWEMAGNVWEWCSSVKKDYPYDPKDGREDPSSSSSRVLRGGSFGFGASNARSAYRYSSNPVDRFASLGFRVGVGVVGAAPFSSHSEL